MSYTEYGSHSFFIVLCTFHAIDSVQSSTGLNQFGCKCMTHLSNKKMRRQASMNLQSACSDFAGCHHRGEGNGVWMMCSVAKYCKRDKRMTLTVMLTTRNLSWLLREDKITAQALWKSWPRLSFVHGTKRVWPNQSNISEIGQISCHPFTFAV